jgi:hypothetical protein
VLQWCYNGVKIVLKVVLKWCYNGVSLLMYAALSVIGCYNDVTLCYDGVTVVV